MTHLDVGYHKAVQGIWFSEMIWGLMVFLECSGSDLLELKYRTCKCLIKALKTQRNANKQYTLQRLKRSMGTLSLYTKKNGLKPVMSHLQTNLCLESGTQHIHAYTIIYYYIKQLDLHALHIKMGIKVWIILKVLYISVGFCHSIPQ